jgi:hypothetical protein
MSIGQTKLAELPMPELLRHLIQAVRGSCDVPEQFVAQDTHSKSDVAETVDAVLQKFSEPREVPNPDMLILRIMRNGGISTIKLFGVSRFEVALLDKKEEEHVLFVGQEFPKDDTQKGDQ